MSAAAGFRHFYEYDKDFIDNFGDFEKKYRYRDSFDGFYYRYLCYEKVKTGMSVIFFQYEKRAHACFGKKLIYDV